MYSTHDETTKNFDELQSDILGEKLTNNPKMKESKILSKNKALATKQKTIINAIVEFSFFIFQSIIFAKICIFLRFS